MYEEQETVCRRLEIKIKIKINEPLIFLNVLVNWFLRLCYQLRVHIIIITSILAIESLVGILKGGDVSPSATGIWLFQINPQW